MKTFEDKIKDIAEKHAKPYLVNEDGDLIETIRSALTEYADVHDDKHLATELLRVAGDRDGWMRKYLDADAAIKRLEAELRLANTYAFEVDKYAHELTGDEGDDDGLTVLRRHITDLVFTARGFEQAAKSGAEDKARMDWLEAHCTVIYGDTTIYPVFNSKLLAGKETVRIGVDRARSAASDNGKGE